MGSGEAPCQGFFPEAVLLEAGVFFPRRLRKGRGRLKVGQHGCKGQTRACRPKDRAAGLFSFRRPQFPSAPLDNPSPY